MSEKLRILIGSPICQKPDVLRMFFFSLERLVSKTTAIDYYFIDDNTDPASSRMLQNFARRHAGHVEIVSAQKSNLEYVCDETTHFWTDDLVWKVAGFKDQIMNHARQSGYDGLFLVDSDLLLQPQTLEVLLASEKDIISEIFWTSWTPISLPAPQVWLIDEYTQYESSRTEHLTPEEQYLRKYSFFGKLRVPGVHEVGGLGACTLIRKKALEAGVSFERIKNLSFWGEDRHFCIRAQALGFSLFVDTHHPAFHLYREADFSEATTWMRQIHRATPIRNGTPAVSAAKSTPRPKITLSMVIHNEADKHLAYVLSKHREYIDEAVIIDDGSTDNSLEICHEVLKGIPLHLVKNTTSQFAHNEVDLRKQQWQETIKFEPEWIVNMDADEVFEDGFPPNARALLASEARDVCCFRLYDMWSDSHYREDPYWHAHGIYRPFILRYRPNHRYTWKEQPLHCGRFPSNIFELPSFLSYFRVKHLGWASDSIRQEKYARYKRLDPSAAYGWKEQYESILDPEPHLVAWRE
ncbi:glycosyltransferase [Brevibacillus reuszeri]|uniref:glycosyltransferase n=1 Tax=Brevibacillus reuszeri TaxID=54915 RepID=UPI003D233F0E